MQESYELAAGTTAAGLPARAGAGPTAEAIQAVDR
jgi:hypothetical protein